ncbi:hypothetical protein BPNPMPFG_000015 [Mesorhizobium sp. AR07]|nr:hypothetical protein [Mesorhizobium sp. AR07]UVK44573.1 hypothetical protein BPNPMPFG_000015 [Mesorhizobium sp. AR07]
MNSIAFKGDANPQIVIPYKAFCIAALLPNLSQFGPIRGAIALYGHQRFG